LLESAQEPNHGTGLMLDLKPKLWKNIFENKFKTFFLILKIIIINILNVIVKD
jgi:hypothetical protein